MTFKKLVVSSSVALVLISIGVVGRRSIKTTALRDPASSSTSSSALVPTSDLYRDRIQPIFDRRCVACHSCFNAPCQLNLSAFEGVERGASQVPVYHANRLKATPPTRLFEDAKSVDEWHSKFGFYSVIEDANGKISNQSIFGRLISMQAATVSDRKFEVEKNRACPKNIEDLDKYLSMQPDGGMPYGFPPLQANEVSELSSWLEKGAPGPKPIQLSNKEKAEIGKWEQFLNGADVKNRIVSRYIYEHLFLAHIHFSADSRDFYRIVRSRTLSPEAIDEIATVRPFDSPGEGLFYYRLRPMVATPVHKTHITYLLDGKKLDRFRQLFYKPKWADPDPTFPSYSPEVASNPFIAFAAIPPRSRYQFLLDDAYYHVKTFIHGPVCYGQIALNVINDHFYTVFLEPDSDLSVIGPAFVNKLGPYLSLPAEGEDDLIKARYSKFKADQLHYLKKKDEYYRKFGSKGFDLNDIWDGDGNNDSAILTVFRHEDSASVVKGAVGAFPKTVWVMDYPIFERIYYNLVAGFDVFGSTIHRASTRQYMDNLRIESEDNFLSFLPSQKREAIRKSWYRGLGSTVKMTLKNPLLGLNRETQIKFKNEIDPQSEFLNRMLTVRMSSLVRGPFDSINVHDPRKKVDPSSMKPGDVSSVLDLEREFSKIASRRGDFVSRFPDLSFIRVKLPDGSDLAYTVIRNKEHENVSFMFFENERRAPKEDVLHIVKGFIGSYPNFFFSFSLDQATDFFGEIQSGGASSEFEPDFIEKFGISRRRSDFWSYADWFNSEFQRQNPVEFGYFDLSRYRN